MAAPEHPRGGVGQPLIGNAMSARIMLRPSAPRTDLLSSLPPPLFAISLYGLRNKHGVPWTGNQVANGRVTNRAVRHRISREDRPSHQSHHSQRRRCKPYQTSLAETFRKFARQGGLRWQIRGRALDDGDRSVTRSSSWPCDRGRAPNKMWIGPMFGWCRARTSSRPRCGLCANTK